MAVPIGMVGGGTSAPVKFEIQGANLDTILAVSEQVQEIMKNVPGTSEVKASVEGGSPEISIRVDREKLAELGLSLDIVGATMKNALL